MISTNKFWAKTIFSLFSRFSAVLDNITVKRFLILVSVLSLITLVGCKKDPDTVGLGVNPDENLIQIGVDTIIPISPYSELTEHFATNNFAEMRVGGMYDPIFGRTSSDLYSQLFISSFSPEFGSNPVADSIKLQIRITGTYGDEESEITLKVNEIVKDDGEYSVSFTRDSTQYSDWYLPVADELLGELTFVPSLDSVLVDTTMYPAIFTIPIDNSFADVLFNAPPDSLAEQSSFTNYFNGIRISCEAPEESAAGQIITIAPTSTYTRLYVYYHNDDQDSLKFTLGVANEAAYFANYRHYDYAEAEPTLKAQLENGEEGTEYAYIQSFAGVRTRLVLPDLSSGEGFAGRIINEAKLVIRDAAIDEDGFIPPTNVFLYTEDSLGVSTNLDETISSSYFNGFYDESNNMIWMRITKYLQHYIDGELDPSDKLYLAAAYEATRGSRLKFYGSNAAAAPEKRIELHVVFTKVNDDISGD